MISAVTGVPLVVQPGSIGAGASGVSAVGGSGAVGGFGELLEKVASEVSGALRGGEQAAAAGVLGTQSVQSTVEAVMGAEQSLQVGIGIRDRIVNAYLELSRMAI